MPSGVDDSHFTNREDHMLHPGQPMRSWIDTRFGITKRGSNIETEIRAGVCMFLAMAYIIAVNPTILCAMGSDLPFSSVLAATCLTAAIGCSYVALFANLPFGLAPGMGLNSYLAYTVVQQSGFSWRSGLSICMIESILFFCLSATGYCTAVQKFAPDSLKNATTVALGLLQAFIGLDMMKMIVTSDSTLLQLGDMTDTSCVFGFAGTMLIAVLAQYRVKGAMIFGVLATVVCAWSVGAAPPPPPVKNWFDAPTLEGSFFQLHFGELLERPWEAAGLILSLLMVVVLDTAGVQFAIGTRAGTSPFFDFSDFHYFLYREPSTKKQRFKFVIDSRINFSFFRICDLL